MSTLKRSIAKTFTYKLITVAETVLIVYAFTGDVRVSAGVGVVAVVIKVITYFLHEVLWGMVRWGQNTKLYEIKAEEEKTRAHVLIEMMEELERQKQ